LLRKLSWEKPSVFPLFEEISYYIKTAQAAELALFLLKL